MHMSEGSVRRRVVRLVWCLTMSILCAYRAHASAPMSVRYVDARHPAARDDNPGSEARPWKTIQKAANTLAPGQAVYVKAGTYAPFTINVHGTPGEYVTFSAAPGDEHKVVIDGTDDTSANRQCIYAKGKSYIRINGFRCYNALNSGIWVEGSDAGTVGIRITNNQVYKTGNAGIMCAGLIMGRTTQQEDRLQDVIIEHNDISRTNEPRGGNECISVGGGVDGVIVRHNYVHDSEQYGIDFKFGVQDGAIYDNHIHTMEKHGIYLDTASRYVKNVVVYDNTIYDCTNGIVMARESGGTSKTLQFVAIYNNLVYDNRKFGVMAYRHKRDDNRTGVFADVQIFNNTIFRNGRDGVRLHGVEGVAKRFVVANNIIYQNKPDVVNKVGAAMLSNLMGKDPLFVSTGKKPDLHLRANSPAVDAAGTEHVPLRDADGVRRPQGRRADCGAYEVMAGGGGR